MVGFFEGKSRKEGKIQSCAKRNPIFKYRAEGSTPMRSDTRQAK
jgi:hypothetical protein